MSEIVIPPWIVPDEENIELVDDNTVRFEPQFGRGQSQRQSYGAPRFKISRKHTIRLGEEANLMSIITAARGSYNTVRTTVKRVLRGTLAPVELLTNNSFASGTSGWGLFNSSTQTVLDRISALKVAGAATAVSNAYGIGRNVQTTTYTVLVARASLALGKNSANYSVALGLTSGATDYGSTVSSTQGLITTAGAVFTTGPAFSAYCITAAGNTYQDYALCSHTSCSICALVDNGPNQLLQSDNLSTTWALTNVTIISDVFIGPDLNSFSEGIYETTANSEHRVDQSFACNSGTVYFSVTLSVRAGNNRNFVVLQVDDGVGFSKSGINLTTGATISPQSAGSFGSLRVTTQVAANGWYNINLSALKTSSATQLAFRIAASTDGTTVSYAGNNVGTAVTVHRVTVAISTVPTRQVLSTTTIVAATAQSGSALFIKGLPASTNGLAMPGDFIEINKELKRVTAPMDSDALGLGYLQFEPEMVNPPIDNAPVIFFEPMGRFILSNVRTRSRVSDTELTYDLEQIYE